MIEKIESMSKVKVDRETSGIEAIGDFTKDERAYHTFVRTLLSVDTEY